MIAETIRLPGFAGIHARCWSPWGEPPPGGINQDARGSVIFVHGLGDHGERHHRLARHLTRGGWSMLAIDLPGHGKSAGRRGSVKNYDQVLRIISAARSACRDRFATGRQVLIGHSMGGNLVFNYALRRTEFEPVDWADLAGVVLVAPMLMPPQFLNRSQILAAWATGCLLPWLRISKRPHDGQLTRDRSAADQLRWDPARHGEVSLYLATQLLAQGRFALDNAAQLATPTLIVQGDEDELVDLAAVRHLALRAGEQARLESWPGGRHDLLHCRDATRVTERLVAWINRLTERGEAVGIERGTISISAARRAAKPDRRVGGQPLSDAA